MWFFNYQFWHSAVLEIKLDQLVSASNTNAVAVQ